jgi:hypothetical protein
LPLQGDVYRVIREDGLLVIIALIESDASAFSEVYGWDYFYGDLPPYFILSLLNDDSIRLFSHRRCASTGSA